MVCVCSACANATWAGLLPRDAEDPDAPKWQEEQLQLPTYPQETTLLPFYVSEITTHRFFVDGATLSVGKDGVIRYVLVIKTGGGATNITFEGIHCDRREYKTYAAGRHDGTWSASRKSEWRRIENKPINRHHAALSRDLFCPGGGSIQAAEEGRNALKLGQHPLAPRPDRP